MFKQLLQHKYVFAVLATTATAALAAAFARVTERPLREPAGGVAYRAFFKTLLSGLLAGLSLAWLAAPSAEPVATVPFDAVLPGVPAMSGLGGGLGGV